MGKYSSVNVGKEAKSLLERILDQINKTCATKQIIFLGVSFGCVLGMLSVRIGKVAAMALGGGIILMQVAKEKAYITINWDTVDKKLDNVANTVEEKVIKKRTSWVEKVKDFARNNTTVTSSFLGGFLIGLGC